jgi:hypothetical protein
LGVPRAFIPTVHVLVYQAECGPGLVHEVLLKSGYEAARPISGFALDVPVGAGRLSVDVGVGRLECGVTSFVCLVSQTVDQFDHARSHGASRLNTHPKVVDIGCLPKFRVLVR